jgi:hypothetical protein
MTELRAWAAELTAFPFSLTDAADEAHPSRPSHRTLNKSTFRYVRRPSLRLAP